MNMQNSHLGSNYFSTNNQLQNDTSNISGYVLPQEPTQYIDGLMTLFMNNQSTRQLAKKITQYSGAGVLGALAHKAQEHWQKNHALNDIAPVIGHDVTQFSPLPQYFAHQESHGDVILVTALMKVMVAASKTDESMDISDQDQILKAAEQLGFSADATGFIYELMTRDIPLEDIANPITLEMHKSKVYLAAYFSVSGDSQLGGAFLEDLAAKLNLESGLSDYLERQAGLGIVAH